LTRDDLIREARRHIIDARHTLDSQSDAVRQAALTHAVLAIAFFMDAEAMRHTVGIAETIRSYEGGGKDE
jgi:hypothetical protein